MENETNFKCEVSYELLKFLAVKYGFRSPGEDSIGSFIGSVINNIPEGSGINGKERSKTTSAFLQNFAEDTIETLIHRYNTRQKERVRNSPFSGKIPFKARHVTDHGQTNHDQMYALAHATLVACCERKYWGESATLQSKIAIFFGQYTCPPGIDPAVYIEQLLQQASVPVMASTN